MDTYGEMNAPPSMTDPDCQPKKITSLLAAKRELASIRSMCTGISTGPPDTFWMIGRRLEPIIDFLTDERRRQRGTTS